MAGHLWRDWRQRLPAGALEEHLATVRPSDIGRHIGHAQWYAAVTGRSTVRDKQGSRFRTSWFWPTSGC